MINSSVGIKKCARERIYHQCKVRTDKSVPRVTVWHHSAEPCDAKNSDPRDRFVFPYLTLMSDSYITTSCPCGSFYSNTYVLGPLVDKFRVNVALLSDLPVILKKNDCVTCILVNE